MAQEVQTTLNYQAELNLIEGVGHQEGKVKEHTQVEQAFGYECSVEGQVALQASASERQSPTLQSTLNITSMSGSTEFKIVNGGLRVPLAGAYMAHIETAGGSSSMTVNTYMRIDGETIYSTTTNASNNWVAVDKILNLGRYNIIEHWGDMYFNSTGYATGYSKFRLTLKKI